MRRRPRAAAAAAIVGTVLVLVVIMLLVRNPDKPSATEPTLATGLPSFTPSPTRKPLVELPSAAATPTSAAQATEQAKNALKGIGQGGTGGLSSGSIDVPGLQGGSVYKYAPKHTIVLLVTSEEPIGTVGYVIPTSLRKSRGIVKNVGKSWSLTTTVYGNPDYAQLFMQAGPIGYPLTCTIKVDGKVTERRSTEGPYGQLICQG